MHIFELCDVAFQHYSLLKLMISSNQSVLFFKILVLFTMIQVCGYRGSSLPHFLTLLLFPPVTQYYSQKEISLLSFFLILIQHERMRDALGIKEATLISCLKKKWRLCSYRKNKMAGMYKEKIICAHFGKFKNVFNADLSF